MSNPVDAINPLQLRQFVPLDTLSDTQLEYLAQYSQVGFLPAGQVVSLNETDEKYYLLKGKISILADNKVVDQIDEDDFDARYALNRPYQNSLAFRAETGSSYLQVALSKLLSLKTKGHNTDPNFWLSRLLPSPLFRQLPDEQIEKILSTLEPVPLIKGKLIVQQGHEAKYWFILRQGQAVVLRKDSKGNQIYDRMQPGDCFGGMALLSGTPYSASVLMSAPGEVMRLSSENFMAWVLAPLKLKSITYPQGMAAVAEGHTQWLDVRLPKEYHKGHLVDSLNVPLPFLHVPVARLQKHFKKLHFDKTILVYSNHENRSKAAVFRLLEQGIAASALKGGLSVLPVELTHQQKHSKHFATVNKKILPPKTPEQVQQDAMLKHSAQLLEQAEEEVRHLATVRKEREQLEQQLKAEQEHRLQEVQNHFDKKKQDERRQLHQLFKSQLKAQIAEVKEQTHVEIEKQQALLDERLSREKQERQQREQAAKKAREHAETEAELLKVQLQAARAVATAQEKDALINQQLEQSRHDHFVHSHLSGWLFGGGLIFVGIAVLAFFLWPDNPLLLTKSNTPIKQPETPVTELSSSLPEAKSEPPQTPEKLTVPLINPDTARALRIFQDKLNNGQNAPFMAQLPAGSFNMGSPASKPYPNEHVQFRVILKSFSISVYEITFTEYQQFAMDTNRKIPKDNDWGRGLQPVINVSWNDAQAYTQWLSAQTGHQYRLPSEREWEYAASAGVSTAYWWGKKIGKNQANCASCGSQWDGKQPAPVGRFAANAFSLHDMQGNILEWTLTCQHDNYRQAPPQGHIYEGGNCTKRAVRGGSYRTSKRDLRLTRRKHYPPTARSNELGFRVVRVQ
ncbi:SUMF1/EgtB/PvdO family nonheme iron enzyme [Candidatus Venteria ishoeyi]|uniref:Serine/threonine-protein kinase pkn1 n=1 Tax=Candidatus Venteria ishoeyi TaxID=1899563 RepID=A0A1H6FGP7_9GAMM|nr:SUMF1/EgtB/PvdO family nonheme iron enzyme [Candidatus Venteria ishoeyi]SEH08601.1 Serine/threonine-protein kinase pkn1 [Candidatus Venteria ishoeyi]